MRLLLFAEVHIQSKMFAKAVSALLSPFEAPFSKSSFFMMFFLVFVVSASEGTILKKDTTLEDTSEASTITFSDILTTTYKGFSCCYI